MGNRRVENDAVALRRSSAANADQRDAAPATGRDLGGTPDLNAIGARRRADGSAGDRDASHTGIDAGGGASDERTVNVAAGVGGS